MKLFLILALTFVTTTNTFGAKDCRKRSGELKQTELQLHESKIRRGKDHVDVVIQKIAGLVGEGKSFKAGKITVKKRGSNDDQFLLKSLTGRISFDPATSEIKIDYSAQIGNSDSWIDDQVIAFRGGARPSLFINQKRGYNNQGEGLVPVINLVKVSDAQVDIRFGSEEKSTHLQFELVAEDLIVTQTDTYVRKNVKKTEVLKLAASLKK